MNQVYIAETPLILEDGSGKEFRVEAGETVALSPGQYQDVAAHVTLLETDDSEETAPPEEPAAGQRDDGDSDGGTEAEAPAQPETKPRGRKDK